MSKWLSTDPDDHYKKDEFGYIFEPLNKCLPPPYVFVLICIHNYKDPTTPDLVRMAYHTDKNLHPSEWITGNWDMDDKYMNDMDEKNKGIHWAEDYAYYDYVAAKFVTHWMPLPEPPKREEKENAI